MVKKIILVLIALLLLSFVPAVSAFGVSASYWDTRPLTLSRGETEVVPLGLQNTLGQEPLNLKAELSAGSEIAKIIDHSLEYYLPLKSKDEVFVNVKIEVPGDAPIGKEYNVAVTLTTIAPGKKGGVGIGMSIVKKFPVIVTTETGSRTDPIIYYGIGAIVIVMIALGLFLLVIKRKKKRRR